MRARGGGGVRRWMLGVGMLAVGVACWGDAGRVWFATYWPAGLMAVGLALVVSGLRHRRAAILGGGRDAD